MFSLSNTLVFIQNQLTRYVYPIYLISGIIGCCLNVILLTRRHFHSVSCCIYLRFASTMMLFFLLIGTIPGLISINHANPYTTIVGVCKIYPYFLQSSSMMFRWCLVAASFDRYVTTSTKVYLRNLATARIAYYVTAIIIIVWIIIPIHILIHFNLKYGACGIFDSKDVALYHAIYTTIMGSILPVTLLTIFSFFIRHNLHVRQQNHQGNLNQQNNNSRVRRKRDQQVFVMLLFQILVYIITQTPWMVFNIYSAGTMFVSNKTTDRVVIEQFTSFVVVSIVYLLPVSSFYVHILVSRTFRKESIKLFRRLIRYRRHHQIHPRTTNHNNIPTT